MERNWFFNSGMVGTASAGPVAINCASQILLPTASSELAVLMESTEIFV